MKKAAREDTARMLRHFAEKVEKGDAEWVWIAVQYPDGRITLGTKDAPKRPRGL